MRRLPHARAHRQRRKIQLQLTASDVFVPLAPAIA
jgi:hypothetical protein